MVFQSLAHYKNKKDKNQKEGISPQLIAKKKKDREVCRKIGGRREYEVIFLYAA